MLIKLLNIVSRALPKTGQTINYADGDDGFYEAGWWKGLLNSNNRTRFVAKTINGDDVVIDRATGLMWAADGNGEGCNSGDEVDWEDSLDACNSLDFAGFTDWRMPNINELLSIVKYDSKNPSINVNYFTNTNTSANYWSSTTYVLPVGEAWAVIFDEGRSLTTGKSGDGCVRCVRGGIK